MKPEIRAVRPKSLCILLQCFPPEHAVDDSCKYPSPRVPTDSEDYPISANLFLALLFILKSFPCVLSPSRMVTGWLDRAQRQPGDGFGSVPSRAVFPRTKCCSQQEIEDEEHD